MAVKQQRRGVAAAGQAADHVEAVGIVADEVGGDAGVGEDVAAVGGAVALVAGRVGGVETDQLPEELGYRRSDSG